MEVRTENDPFNDTEIDVTAECLDPSGAVVARATVRWRVGPVRR